MTDERDPKVSQRYRDLPGEEPSRELDQAILAAAHRATEKPHAPLLVPAGRHRWYFSLAAAAILVLAVAVTVHVEHQQSDAELAIPPAPAPAPAPQATPAPAAKPEPHLRQDRSPVYAPEPPAPPPAAPAPPPMGAPQADEARLADAKAEAEQAAAEAQEAQAYKERAAAESPANAASSAQVPRAAPAARSAGSAATQYAAVSPERELQRIADLRAQGRDEEADKALAEFHKRYPGYQIPEAMRQKVEKKANR